MTEADRNAIFISHANPEDNPFTIWLGARLTAAGYEVWADVLRLRGGHDWQRRLEQALRERACKVLLVGTAHGVQKQGVRNEIQIAHTVSRRIDDQDFIIPLRLTDFDAPFLVVHAQYIDFKRSWADGLAELLETLDVTYGVPRNRSSSAGMVDYWKEVHLRHAQPLAPKPEQLISNWLAIDQMPDRIFFYDFRPGISVGAAKRQMRSAPWPLVPFRRGFLALCPLHDLQDHFGPGLPLVTADEADAHLFLEHGWPEQDIAPFDAHNRFSDLVRQAIELALSKRTLSCYPMAADQLAWWGTIDRVPTAKISFRWSDLLTGRRQIVGYSKKHGFFWHYGITPKPRIVPFPHVRLVGRVIFSEDGRVAFSDPKRMHRLRRSFARSWRNARWRDMLLAFLHWLADGQETIAASVGSEAVLTLRLPPIIFTAPVSVVGLDDDEEPDVLDEDDRETIDLDDVSLDACENDDEDADLGSLDPSDDR